MKELSMQNGEVVDCVEHKWNRHVREGDSLPHWECSDCGKIVESDPTGP